MSKTLKKRASPKYDDPETSTHHFKKKQKMTEKKKLRPIDNLLRSKNPDLIRYYEYEDQF